MLTVYCQVHILFVSVSGAFGVDILWALVLKILIQQTVAGEFR